MRVLNSSRTLPILHLTSHSRLLDRAQLRLGKHIVPYWPIRTSLHVSCQHLYSSSRWTIACACPIVTSQPPLLEFSSIMKNALSFAAIFFSFAFFSTPSCPTSSSASPQTIHKEALAAISTSSSAFSYHSQRSAGRCPPISSIHISISTQDVPLAPSQSHQFTIQTCPDVLLPSFRP